MSEEVTQESSNESTGTRKASLLSWIGFLFGVLVVLLVCGTIAGYFLPREYEIETSIVIDANTPVVFPRVASQKRWQEWCPWTPETIDGLASTYSGPDEGVGSTWTWTAPSGNGEQQVTLMERDIELELDTHFADLPVMTTVIRFEQQPDGKSTKVTWRSRGRVPDGPLYGWMGMTMLPSAMQGEFDSGLRKLKQVCEGDTEAIARYADWKHSGHVSGGPSGGPGGGPGGGAPEGGGPGDGRPAGGRPGGGDAESTEDTPEPEGAVEDAGDSNG